MAKRKNNKKQTPVHSKKDLVFGIIFMLSLIVAAWFCFGQPAERGDYSVFLDALGARESSDRYDAKNRFGYLGRYQMGELALQDAGFLDENGEWTFLANGYGIFSESDFLQSPEGQEAAIRACHTKVCTYIKSYGMDDYLGKTYCGVKVTKSGLLAACHLVGAKNMHKALQNNEMVYDGNHVPASEYMNRFSGYDISEVWKDAS